MVRNGKIRKKPRTFHIRSGENSMQTPKIIDNCIVVFDKDKTKTLFCKRMKEPFKGTLNFVGGKVEPGESSEDAAYRELFGGFAPAFYESYFDCADLEPGYSDRRDLYNLYHLLNHLNLFGTAYLSSVRRILRWYS